MKVLAVTNLFPTEAAPASGTFVHEQVESLRALGVDVDVLHIRRAEGRGAYLRLARTIDEAVERSRPDVVHAMYGGVLAYGAARALRGQSQPLVVSFCGSDLLGGGDGGLGMQARERLGVLASRRSLAHTAGVIVKSAGLERALPASFPRDRVWVIPSGVDLELFVPRDHEEARRELGWAPDLQTVLFASATTRPEKRFDRAQAAFAELERRRPDVELRALDGVARADVPLWLNAADVVLLTSSTEGSPNVIKEALACCTPIVSVDVGDVRERIDGIVGNAVVEPTPDALAAALLTALDAPRDPRARERAASVSLERTAEQTRAVYEAVLDGSPASEPRG